MLVQNKYKRGVIHGFALCALTVAVGLTIDNHVKKNDFPPRKPPVIIEGRDCYIDGQIVAPSGSAFISMEDL